MIGTHTVLVYTDPAAPTGTPVDVTAWVDEVSIVHGRSGATEQPEASAATLDVSLDPWPVVVEIGVWIKVTTTVAGQTFARFLGRVTDIGQSWDEAAEDTPDRPAGTIVAVGALADFSRRVVGDEAWPQELDGNRVARVFALAGYSLDPAYSDPGVSEIVPRDVDRQPALDIAAGTANSAGGLIWATRDGEIRYADAEHRRNTVVALDLEASDVLAAPTWMRNLEGLVNEVTFTYGVPPLDEAGNEGPLPTYYAVRADSQAKYGRYEYATTVELATEADAVAAAELLLVQNSWPAWMLQELPLDVAGLTTAQTQTLLGLDVHGLIRVGGMPAAGNVPTSVAAWVEGWQERLAHGSHELTLAVSDYCRTAPPPRWNDLATSTTWDNIGAAVTWDSAACLGPPVNLGTWDTVPATLRWDQVPATVTWDTWGAA